MVQIDINLTGVYKKLDTQNVQSGQYAVANQALADMNPFVPMDEGITRQTGHVNSDGTAVLWDTPYVRRLFYMPMYNYTTPGTGPRWDIKATRMFMNNWINAFMKGAGW